MTASTGFDMKAYFEAERARWAEDDAREAVAGPGSSKNPLSADPAREPRRTAAQIAAGATVWDSWRMPTAFSEDGMSYHPTACCGLPATGTDYGISCKGCYGDASEFGGAPTGPYTSFSS